MHIISDFKTIKNHINDEEEKKREETALAKALWKTVHACEASKMDMRLLKNVDATTVAENEMKNFLQGTEGESEDLQAARANSLAHSIKNNFVRQTSQNSAALTARDSEGRTPRT